MTALLDVNILIALADAKHQSHEIVSEWFLSVKARSWATCPITENGFIRILAQPAYTNLTDDIEAIRKILLRLRAAPGHQFWPDSISISETNRITNLHNSKATTDLYLLALAVKNKGQLATLDSKIKATSVSGASDAYLLIKGDR